MTITNQLAFDFNLLEFVGITCIAIVAFKFVKKLVKVAASFFHAQPPAISVLLTKEESSETLSGYPKFDLGRLVNETETVFHWDPSTLDYFGEVNAMTAEEVNATVERARTAQRSWKTSSFATRRLLMRTMRRYISENQVNCARVAVRDSGKTLLDALIGEVLVTCEKLVWLENSGEQLLSKEYRETGRMMMMKEVYVEYIPLGVIGAIVPWNYP